MKGLKVFYSRIILSLWFQINSLVVFGELYSFVLSGEKGRVGGERTKGEVVGREMEGWLRGK